MELVVVGAVGSGSVDLEVAALALAAAVVAPLAAVAQSSAALDSIEKKDNMEELPEAVVEFAAAAAAFDLVESAPQG